MSRIAAAFTDGKSDIRGMYWPKTVISGRIFICFINGRQNRRMKYFHNVYYLHFRFFVLMPPHGEWFLPQVTTLKQLPSNNRLLGRGTKGPGTMKPQNPLRIKHPCLTPFGSPLPLPSAPIAMMVNNHRCNFWRKLDEQIKQKLHKFVRVQLRHHTCSLLHFETVQKISIGISPGMLRISSFFHLFDMKFPLDYSIIETFVVTDQSHHQRNQLDKKQWYLQNIRSNLDDTLEKL